MALRVLDALLESLEHSCATGFQPTIDGLNPTRRTAAIDVLTLVRNWSTNHPLSSGDSPRLQADLRVAPRQ
jgi:hypothetical protein